MRGRSDFDLNLLPVLDALLQEGNVTRAAKRVGLSQSATSHALARLRSLTGDAILVRTPDGMAPTARAQSLAGPVRRALDEIAQGFAPPQPFDPADSSRRFTLSLEDAGQVGLLPLLAEALKQDAPGVDVVVSAAGVRDPLEGLAVGAIDLALTVSPEPRTGLHEQVVFETPYVSIVQVGHPDVGKRLTLKRFASLRHVVLAGPGSVDPELDRQLDALSCSRRAALTVPSLLPIPWLVARSDFVATVPALLLGLDQGRPPLARHKPPVPLEPVRGSLVWHERTQHDPAHQWLRGLVSRVCGVLAAPVRSRAKQPARAR